MKAFIVLCFLSFQTAGAAEVLVRYNNWYNGDSDHFAQCLIDSRGTVTIIGQGLQAVDIKHSVVASENLNSLKSLLKNFPVGAKEANYNAYDFMEVGESMEVSMSAGYRKGHEFKYFLVGDKTVLSNLVKGICKID